MRIIHRRNNIIETSLVLNFDDVGIHQQRPVTCDMIRLNKKTLHYFHGGAGHHHQTGYVETTMQHSTIIQSTWNAVLIFCIATSFVIPKERAIEYKTRLTTAAFIETHHICIRNNGNVNRTAIEISMAIYYRPIVTSIIIWYHFRRRRDMK